MKCVAKTLAAAGVAFLTACGPAVETPIHPKTYRDMEGMPDGTFRLFPTQLKETGEPIGRFMMVIKERQIRTENAYDKDGHKGVQTCTNYRKAPVRLDETGKLELEYTSSGYRCYSVKHVLAAINGDQVTYVPRLEGRGICSNDYALSSSVNTVCSFARNPTAP